MIKKILFLFLFFSFNLQAQYTIKGKFTPPEKINWVILYRLENSKGIFVGNSDVFNGKFKFIINEKVTPGMYRILYQTQKQQFADIIVNNENISFNLNPEYPESSIHFTASEENKIYQNYLKIINSEQKKLDSIQILYFKSKDSHLEEKYKKQLGTLTYFQKKFEKESSDKLSSHFIKAEKLYNPEIPETSSRVYLNMQRNHYLDYVDLNDPVLINSAVINDKLTDHIFKFNNAQTKEKTEILQKIAIDELSHKLQDKYHILQPFEERIIHIYLSRNQSKMARYVFEKYYLKLPVKYIDPAFKESVQGDLKTAVGSKSPNLKWKEHKKVRSLYDLNNKTYYIIVFFSTDCSHCLKQMPVFYKTFKSLKNIQVITIGLEDEKDWWQDMTSKWKEFINIIDLKKWESKRVKDFGVTATPTYFVLDKNKIIMAKPNDVNELTKVFGIK